MRILLEIVLIAFIAFVGWRQPFRDLVRTRFPQTEIAPSRLALRTLEAEHRARNTRAAREARSSGDWMFNQPGALDRRPQ